MVNQLWLITVLVNSWKNRAFPELSYKSNKPQVFMIYKLSYNNPSYSRILIGSRLWYIRGQRHDWRHHYRVFSLCFKMAESFKNLKIIFYATGQMIRYKKVLPRHWTGSRSRNKKDKAVSYRKRLRKNTLAVSVGNRARLNPKRNWSLN